MAFVVFNTNNNLAPAGDFTVIDVEKFNSIKSLDIGLSANVPVFNGVVDVITPPATINVTASFTSLIPAFSGLIDVGDSLSNVVSITANTGDGININFASAVPLFSANIDAISAANTVDLSIGMLSPVASMSAVITNATTVSVTGSFISTVPSFSMPIESSVGGAISTKSYAARKILFNF